MNFEIDYNDKTPVYKQIIKKLNEAIINGEFSSSKKLPTERELSEKFNVARGTIKNAYNELEKQGKVRKIQGRGTFPIGKVIEDEGEFIVESIRTVVNNLISLNLNEEQIKGIIIKEIWNRLKCDNRVSLGWIDCSRELLSVSAKQISDKCNIKVKTFLVEEIIENPDLIIEKFDLIATTLSHYSELINVIPPNVMLMERVILTVSNKTVSEIAKITKEKKVAVLYRSDNFLELVNDNLTRINNIINKKEFNVPRECAEFTKEIDKYDIVIVPPDYDEDENGELSELTYKFKRNNITIIVFEYMLDKGSLIHLEEKAQRFWLNKNNRQKM